MTLAAYNIVLEWMPDFLLVFVLKRLFGTTTKKPPHLRATYAFMVEYSFRTFFGFVGQATGSVAQYIEETVIVLLGSSRNEMKDKFECFFTFVRQRTRFGRSIKGEDLMQTHVWIRKVGQRPAGLRVAADVRRRAAGWSTCPLRLGARV